MINIKASKLSRPLFYSFVLITFLSCTPLLHGVLGYILSCIILLFVIVSMAGSRAYHEKQSVTIGSLLFLGNCLIYRIVGISTAAPGYYLGMVPFFLIVMLLPIVPINSRQKDVRRLWWFMMIIILFNIADNIRLSILHPEINTMRFHLDKSFLSSINAGDSYFYTISLFFFCVSFFVWLNVSEKRVKWFSFFASAITALYICWYCFKASVILFFFLSVVLIYYSKKVKRTSTFLAVAFITGFAVVFVVGVLSDYIIDYIITYSPNARVTARLVTLIDENAVEAQEATVTGRTSLYMVSIKTWLTDIFTFFMGIGDHFQVLGAAKTGIGQHATFPDTLGRYGILGFSVLMLMLRACVKCVLSFFEKKYHLQVLTIFLIYFLNGCVKGMLIAGVGCVLFLLLPLSSVFLNKNKTNYN